MVVVPLVIDFDPTWTEDKRFERVRVELVLNEPNQVGVA
jgi:hypothetical protein